MAAVTDTPDLQGNVTLLRLMQLISPALPVGAFAFSQGLEWAVEAGWICNARQTFDWIDGVLRHGPARLDLPVMARLYRAWQDRDLEEFRYWNQFLLSARGSAEMQQEDLHMGQALCRLIGDLIPEAITELPTGSPSYAAMFAAAALNWGIGLEAAGTGFLWSWAENQIAAAIKLVPLGQTQGQAILLQIAERIPSAVKNGLAMESEEIGAVTPALSIASALHETQHTRLFRS